MQKILIVEDDTNINNLLREALSKEGYSCEQAFSGTEAKLLLNMQKHGYALVLLDLMLPGISGEAVLEEIRKKGNLPVIVLTAKDSLDEKVEVLTSGADDYITKPFSIRELLARVKANLRKADVNSDIKVEETEQKETKEEEPIDIKRTNIISVGVLTLDLDRFEVMVNNRVVDLTLREFEVLKFLASDPGQVITREVLLEKVWGYEYYGDIRTVDVTVRRLREKLEDDSSNPRYIMTKRGIGYYFRRP